MSILSRLALALALVAISGVSVADGIYNRGTQSVGSMGGDGVNTPGAASVPTIPCTQTGLVFTASCNAILFVVVFN
jgi:hypothetical protein